MKRVTDPDVAAVFNRHPPPVKARLMRLRALILETAAATDGVGPLQETLKWGQPSYLTSETKSGVTVRIDAVKGGEGAIGLYVHCQSGLVDRFRALYANELRFSDNRAIVFAPEDDIPRDAVRHCIAMALTHHREKKRAAQS